MSHTKLSLEPTLKNKILKICVVLFPDKLNKHWQFYSLFPSFVPSLSLPCWWRISPCLPMLYFTLSERKKKEKKKTLPCAHPWGVCVYAFACFCAFTCDTMWASELLFLNPCLTFHILLLMWPLSLYIYIYISLESLILTSFTKSDIAIRQRTRTNPTLFWMLFSTLGAH